MDTKKIVEIARRVWKEVFGVDNLNIQVNVNDDPEVLIDGTYSIIPATVKVERVSLLGTEVSYVDGYSLYVWQQVSGGYMEPDDVDDIYIGENTSAYDIVQLAAETYLQNMCRITFENMSFEEMMKEKETVKW